MHLEIINKKKKQIKLGMRAIMFRELSSRELQIYRTGFKNGYRLAETHLVFKSQALVDEYLRRIAIDGRSARSIGRDDDMPSYEAFYNLMNKDEVVRSKYFLAQES